MQLSDAIDGWLAAHSAGLSGSTRRDITDIGASAERCGFAWMDCVDVRERHIDEIVADADARSSLNASAIAQFLEIAVEWAITQTEAAGGQPVLPSDTDGWLDTEAPPVVDDLDLDAVSWVDELPPVDDLDVDNDGELDPVDQEQTFEVDDIPDADASEVEPEPAEPEADDSKADGGEPEEPVAADDELIDEDDFDADELEAIDDDLTTTDEDDLDEDELDDIDDDLATLIEDLGTGDEPAADDDVLTGDDDLFMGGDDLFLDDSPAAGAADPAATAPPSGSAFATAAAAGAPSDPAASSFLRTLEQTGQTPAVFGQLASEPSGSDVAAGAATEGAATPSIDTTPGGIFSEAAQYDGERSIDWITVAYFAVAAICFALVIYFYLSS